MNGARIPKEDNKRARQVILPASNRTEVRQIFDTLKCCGILQACIDVAKMYKREIVHI